MNVQFTDDRALLQISDKIGESLIMDVSTAYEGQGFS
jgi:hypothetical protein